MSQFTLKDIPASELDEVIRDFESEGATTQTIRQDDGRFTVVATFPEPRPAMARATAAAPAA